MADETTTVQISFSPSNPDEVGTFKELPVQEAAALVADGRARYADAAATGGAGEASASDPSAPAPGDGPPRPGSSSPLRKFGTGDLSGTAGTG